MVLTSSSPATIEMAVEALNTERISFHVARQHQGVRAPTTTWSLLVSHEDTQHALSVLQHVPREFRIPREGVGESRTGLYCSFGVFILMAVGFVLLSFLAYVVFR